jgi:hypothetical protein
MGGAGRVRARLLLLLGLPAALLLAAWLGPPLWNWEGERDRVAAIASLRLGRPVHLDGPLRVTLLPRPMVEAASVRVGTAGQEEIAVSARALRLRLSLLPLLRGRFEPRELVLVGADVRIPWPPPSIGALRPPPWLTDFDARIEEGRVAVGDAVLEGVAARLDAPGPLDAVRVEGSVTWRGAPVRFEAVVGRPGYDGIATLDIGLGFARGSATARGILVAEGGFEGRIEAGGADLSTLIAAPPGPFRASGRVTITGELAAADDLALDLGGVTGRGAATFRFAPEPRLDIALALARLDLDAWIAAVRGAATPALPVGLDLSAEAAAFRGLTIRRLRGGIVRDRERITLTEVSALLPGEAALELSGASTGSRLELAFRVAGQSLRASLAPFGLAFDRVDPARLRGFEGRGRMVLEPTQAGVPEFAGTVDGIRIGGAGVLRYGERPALGLGLSVERLDLDGLMPAADAWAALLRAGPGMDANLRLAAETVQWGGLSASRAALDAVAEGGRVGLRRLSAQVEGADIVLAGSVATGATPRFADVVLEVAATSAAGIARLFEPVVAIPQGFAAQALRLRIAGGGPAEALAFTAEGDLGELRIEAQGSADAAQSRLAGTLALRHPGAPRLAMLLGARETPAWLGEGSFSLIAALAGTRVGWTAETLDFVAGGMRARGRLALALGDARPRLTGRIAAERLPLPGLALRDSDPLGFGVLGALDAELALEAAELVLPGLSPLGDVAATARLEGGRLALEGLRARLGGGTVEGTLSLDVASVPPVLAGAIGLAGATLTGPLFGTPFDLASGRIEAQGRFSASGYAPAALLATLTGEGRIALLDGVVAGAALGAAVAASALDDPTLAETGMRAALDGGATAVERLEGGWRAVDGVVSLEGMRMVGQGGFAGGIEGRIDLPRGSLDLRFTAQPPGDQAPPIALRVTGPAETPRRQSELTDWARWRAEQ